MEYSIKSYDTNLDRVMSINLDDLNKTEDGKYTGKFHTEMYDLKKETLQAFCNEHNLTLEGSIGVGDTAGDISFLELVENPICFNPNQPLHTAAVERGWKIVIERKDVVYEITP